MKRIGTVFAYAVLAALLAVTVLGQVAIVWLADEATRSEFPELRYLWIPYSSAGVLTVLFLQIALISIFALVRLSRRGKIYHPSALRYIDSATVAVMFAGLIPMVVIQHLNWAENANPPLLMLFFLALLVLTPAVVGLARVARRVYLRARDEHEELKGVI